MEEQTMAKTNEKVNKQVLKLQDDVTELKSVVRELEVRYKKLAVQLAQQGGNA